MPLNCSLKFSIAVDRPTKNQETGERETDFVDIVAWRRTALAGGVVAEVGRRVVHRAIVREGEARTVAGAHVQRAIRAERRGQRADATDQFQGGFRGFW